MLNKSIAFGLLAAGLMIAPTAAFAGQSQNSDQYTEQNGAATNGSYVNQTSHTNSRQIQNQTNVRRGVGYGGSRHTPQGQNSRQGTVQSGAAVDGSETVQHSTSNNNQRQNATSSGTGYRRY